MKCIGSVEELVAEIEKSVAASLMKENPYKNFKPGDLSKENYSTTGSTCTVLTWTISCWFRPKANRCGANRI